MPWIEPVSATIKTASLAATLAKESSFIKRLYARFIYWKDHGCACIPIFGSSGVGKTTASKILLNGVVECNNSSYQMSTDDEVCILNGNIPGKIVVVPGQISDFEYNWKHHINDIVNGKCFGLINIVSYGYHSFCLETFKDHDLYKKDMSVDDFVDVYTEHRRNHEIDLLKKICTPLKTLQSRIWFITIINKQDLWWDKKALVRKHYYDGVYNSIISDLKDEIGGGLLQHIFAPVSFEINNWTTGNNERLANTVVGYDNTIQLRHIFPLFRSFSQFLARGKGND